MGSKNVKLCRESLGVYLPRFPDPDALPAGEHRVRFVSSEYTLHRTRPPSAPHTIGCRRLDHGVLQGLSTMLHYSGMPAASGRWMQGKRSGATGHITAFLLCL